MLPSLDFVISSGSVVSAVFLLAFVFGILKKVISL